MNIKKDEQSQIESIIEINYSKPLSFIRENKNHFPKTEILLSVLETLQAISYYCKNSGTTNKEYIILKCLETSKTDIQKAIKELESLISIIPCGISLRNILETIIIYKKATFKKAIG
ncbi:hypothetical protein SAMN02927937_02553 [Paenimyroides aquimaris]|uniref:Four helix bundle protein n=1 Tax=Paenimyroides marinum TaxID=1159016 RepID=A0A1H6MJG4_9FLAO|nr:hypothetical protein [Paenimyroides aquimaris]SEH98575.1 hypothetical protein SAMN02927937_02553 [Paenimyroides aquimaris]